VTASAAAFDVASEEGLRLQRLADEIGRIARSLIDLPEGLVGSDGRISDRPISFRGMPPADLNSNGATITAAEVRAIIRLRRLRDRYFSSELFADPAWDMLLDLAAARIERTRVAVSSLCIAAAVPPTTALRWIKAMTEQGLLRRVADPHDARRIFIQLSDDAAAAMEQYLRAARSGGGLTI
jgi:DNA-binding MarR family transcriptional regulator